MISKKKEEKKGKVKIGKLKVTQDLSAEEAKKVKGGKANFTEFNFVHKTDKTSPVLS